MPDLGVEYLYADACGPVKLSGLDDWPSGPKQDAALEEASLTSPEILILSCLGTCRVREPGAQGQGAGTNRAPGGPGPAG